MISHRNNLYLEKKQYLLLIFIVLLGSFNYGILGITNINLNVAMVVFRQLVWSNLSNNHHMVNRETAERIHLNQ